MIPGINKRVLSFHDLMLYVALIRNYSRLMVLLMCMSMLGGMALYIYSRPVYYSKANIAVETLGLPLDTDQIYHDGNLYNILFGLYGEEVTVRAAERFGVHATHAEIMSKYLRQIKITPNPNGSGSINIETFSYVPSWPAHWAEYMVEAYTKLRQEQREKNRDQVLSAYGAELHDINAKIKDDENSKFSFEDQTNYTKATIDAARLRALPTDIAMVKQRIDQLESLRQRLDDPTLDVVDRLSLISSADAVAPVQVGQSVSEGGNAPAGESVANSSPTGTITTGTGANATSEVDPVLADSVVVPGIVAETQEWQKIEKRQRELLKEKADLMMVYKEGNAKVTAVVKDLDQVQRTLQTDYDVARARFDMIRNSLQDHYDDLQKKLPEYEKVTRQYETIQKSAQLQSASGLSWSQLYSQASKTAAEYAYTVDKEKVNLHYMQMQTMKDIPVSPNKMKLFFISFVMGVVLAFGVPFLIEYLDYTLSNLEEVEATFQMRGLGIIPQIAHEADSPMLLNVTAEGDERNLVENFRIVRTNLLAMGTLTKAAHVTMITSAMPKEGKTLVSSNLAISFGQTGGRTLLIDTDLRRGRLHRLFGFRKSPGLSDYLLDKVPLEDTIRASGKENLWIISAGQHVEAGTELLGSSKFSELMTRLRGEFDRIIVDTPPVLGLSETSVIQHLVDGVLFVIWSGRTPIRNMKTAIEILSANGANFYGFILNRLDLSATTNYYHYYYYSSDYYHSYHALENT